MKLPSKSSWHFIKGTWFVYKKGDLIVHIQLKNNGMQYVYLNGELASSQRSLKIKSEMKFKALEKDFIIRIKPKSKALTSYDTELVIDNILVKTFSLSQVKNLKVYLPFLITVVLLTIPIVLLKWSTWTLYAMVGVVVILQLVFFNRYMYVLSERDADVKIDI